jgi:putative cell wall-binding protein
LNTNQNTLAALARRTLNAGHTEYARHKAIISQFFRSSCAVENKKEVRYVRLIQFMKKILSRILSMQFAQAFPLRTTPPRCGTFSARTCTPSSNKCLWTR